MIAHLFPAPVITVRATPAMWSGEAYAQEMASIARATPKRRREFVAGRLCAREALRQLGIDHFPLIPNADRTPRWPFDVVGSIAHCGDYCGVAVARRDDVLGVGLDVEHAGPLPAEIVESVCAAEELEAMSATPAPSSCDWAKLIFSAKEAFYKCYYPLTQRFLEFRDVRVTLADDQTFVAQLARPDAPSVAGQRELQGRWATTTEHVFAGVTYLKTAATQE